MRDYVDGRVTHQSGLPHLPRVPHFHVNRPQGEAKQLNTPQNTITYHNALCLSPQNFA